MISSSMQASKTLFAVVISEKGGAERREVFDRPELSVGRVQGNDLMLPKGNVSKRHARLVYRDGRFIVSDLNSTNGTYVNRRRISQATIVREGDRIYIGDFVLRVELPEGAAPPSSQISEPSPAEAASSLASSPADAVSAVPAEPPPVERSRPYPEVPRPPRIPSTSRLIEGDQYPSSSRIAPSPSASRGSTSDRTPSVERHVIPERAIAFPEETAGAEAKAHRSALLALVSHVLETVKPEQLEGKINEALAATIDRLLKERVSTLETQSQLPRSIPAQRLQTEARAELVDVGPLRALLDDPEVIQIAVPHYDRIEILRGGTYSGVHPGFSSEAALERALRRLLREAGTDPGAGLIEARLPQGSLSAVTGSASRTGALLVIDKLREPVMTLEQLVRSGMISRAIATFLQQSVLSRLNILVVASRDGSAGPIASALCSFAADRLVFANEVEGIGTHRGAIQLDLTASTAAPERLLSAALRLPESRLVGALRSPEVTLAILDAATEQCSGILGVTRGPNLRRTIARLASEVAAHRLGGSPATAREWISGTFDIAIEVMRLRDGRDRVIRVSELGSSSEQELALNDIFVFVPDRTAAGGAIEGTFVATGFVPRVAEDMATRGFAVDQALFSRTGPR